VSRVQANGSTARPIGTFSQKIHSPDERADGDGETADGPPGAERETASLGRHGRRQQGERQRDQHRGPDPLHRAGRDQQPDAGCERGRGRAEGEQPEAGDEHPATPVALAQGGAGEQQHRERQRVRVNGPLQAGQ
jgi:hypothetical protein